jgi:GntR family transcriptional regulator
MDIPIRVSADSAEPLYHQIKEQLRALIVSGQLQESSLLPSIREFAQQLSCSVITIRRVYQDLENEGLLRTRQGTGTFVASVGDGDREQYRYEAVYKALKEAVQAGLRVQYTKDELLEIVQQIMDEQKENGSLAKEGK